MSEFDAERAHQMLIEALCDAHQKINDLQRDHRADSGMRSDYDRLLAERDGIIERNREMKDQNQMMRAQLADDGPVAALVLAAQAILNFGPIEPTAEETRVRDKLKAAIDEVTKFCDPIPF